MFVVRLGSSVLLMAVVLLTTIAGGRVLAGTLLLLSLLGMYELYRSTGFHKSLLGAAGYVTAVLLYATVYVTLEFGKVVTVGTMGVMVLALTLMMTVYVLRYPKYEAKQVTMAFFGLFYVAFALFNILALRSVTGGAYLVWLVYIGAWGSDTFAYVVGMLVGKHRLPSELSPKKTVEGCVGGVVGAMLIGLLFFHVFGKEVGMSELGRWRFVLFASLAAVLSQIGDLAASAIKRNMGIKDYGSLIPGHGGVLDRFDSVIFVAPILYYVLNTLEVGLILP